MVRPKFDNLEVPALPQKYSQGQGSDMANGDCHEILKKPTLFLFLVKKLTVHYSICNRTLVVRPSEFGKSSLGDFVEKI